MSECKNRNLYSKNPETEAEQNELFELRRKKGCAVCCKRDLRAMVIGGLACSIPGNYPRPTYCYHWELDEGELKNANNTKAA